MRIIAILPLAGLVLLAACGEGSAFDQGFKKSFREKYVENCTKSATSAAPAGQTAIDFAKLCGCTADKVMEGRSATELANLSDADQQKAASVCIAQLYPGMPGGNAAAN
jgi:hypothetical protein